MQSVNITTCNVQLSKMPAWLDRLVKDKEAQIKKMEKGWEKRMANAKSIK